MDTDAQSYTIATLLILFSYQLSYLDAVEAKHASFTPFVTSIDGVLAREDNSVTKLLATKVVLKWGKQLSEACPWCEGVHLVCRCVPGV
ncbi:hypothetical protein EMCRGX_G010411 [Ephydatia muelleri]